MSTRNLTPNQTISKSMEQVSQMGALFCAIQRLCDLGSDTIGEIEGLASIGREMSSSAYEILIAEAAVESEVHHA